MKFLFSIANDSDDEELREVTRQIYMPGDIALSFHREPSFFTAEKVGGQRAETIVCRRSDTGKIIGFGGRSLRRVYLGGQEKTIWYLHNLRLLEKERNGIALIRGYQYFHSLSNESDTEYFFTTILDDNLDAKKILESGRGGMPMYKRVGTLETYLIPIRKKYFCSDKHIDRCDDIHMAPAIKYLASYNSHYDLASVCCVEDIRNDGSLLPNFHGDDLYVYKKRGQINGTLGVWDQHAFKQTIVSAYSPRMKFLRHVHNIWAGIRNLPYLSKVGQSINMVYGSFMSCEDNDTHIFSALVDRARSDWSGIGYDWLVLGLCTGHPLMPVLAKKSTRKISSGIYLVYWNEAKYVLPLITNFPHLEISLL